MGCELMWATTWMHGAHEMSVPLLGLPHLRVADLPGHDGDHGVADLQWKTEVLVRTADGRPSVWAVGALGDADRTSLESEHPAGALLHRVDLTVGKTVADRDTIAIWLRDVGSVVP